MAGVTFAGGTGTGTGIAPDRVPPKPQGGRGCTRSGGPGLLDPRRPW